jgi:hypothetical protein
VGLDHVLRRIGPPPSLRESGRSRTAS